MNETETSASTSASADGWWVPAARDAVLLAGPDAAAYLHSQVSQDLRPLQVGGSTWTFVLQPTGKIEVLARVTRTGDDTFVLDTEAGFGDVLLARLARFKIRVRAELTTLGWTSIAVRGVAADTTIEADDVIVVPAWGGGVDVLGAAPSPPEGLRRASGDDLLAARIEAGWPAMGAEIVPGETIPAETGTTVVGAAVSFTKGCYPGQELVERMDSRGSSAPRQLQVVDVAPGTVAGDRLVREGDVIGTVTSVHGTRALALVKRSALVDGDAAADTKEA